MDWKPLFPAVRLAVELTRRVRALAVNHSDKSANDPVTIADYGAQALLLHAISRLHPHASVLSEERSEQFLTLVSPENRALIARLLGEVMGENATEADVVRWLDFGAGRDDRELWTVDPIDGTRGYVGGGRYCVAIGIMTDRVPTAGLLACPVYPSADGRGRMFYTIGDASYSEPLDGGEAARISVRSVRESAQFLPIESTDLPEIDHPILMRACDYLGIGEIEIPGYEGQDKYATIANGDADFYLRPERPQDRLHYIWDHVPGTAILTRAGGIASDLTGKPLDFTHGDRLPTLGLIVSSRAAHERIVAAYQAIKGG